ncbi:hypothetical protein H6F95_09860 [Cyanobacteria bacterium FACHB-471]|nr:hypothetical protein [Cyanobacteria bacterium FACHB-471]
MLETITTQIPEDARTLEDLEETERQALAQKYLRNPFSVRWSTLAQLSQTSEL